MLKSRLKLIESIFANKKSVDIGADHGFLTISLLENKNVLSAIIVEVNKGPFDNSLNNIKKHGYSNKVEVILGDGLKPFTNEFDQDTGIIIAGMGGKLISSILFANPAILGNATLYLQPNNGESTLRTDLLAYGYQIEEDLLVEDTDIIYTVIKATKGTQKLSYNELLYGYKYNNKDDLFIQRYTEELAYMKKQIMQIPPSSDGYIKFQSLIINLEQVLGE